MTAPRALYRLQFRNGMDFDKAAALAPYLARLGISHLYASPLFQARLGSTHGYDVTDHGRLDDSLGGMQGFLRLSEALRAAGIGLILDIVPNHMAASPENPWWRDLLRYGRESRYAHYFDVDWQAPKLLLPLLGQPFAAALQAGEFSLTREDDGLTWRYFEHGLPLRPCSWGLVLSPAGIDLADSGFSAWIADKSNALSLDAALTAASADTGLLQAVHEAQHWRLAYWRAGRDALTYRRFFEIADLVGLRVEDPQVFEDVHRLIFELIEAGHVHGLRVDHVDGLADPAGYLRRLAEQVPGSPPIWVEKILAPSESLPTDWPVCGTSGYDFAHAAGALLIDPAAKPAVTRAHERFTGTAADPEAMLFEAKREILTWNLAAELEVLTALATRAAAADNCASDWGRDSLRRAVVALAVAMPVYRSYLREDEPPSASDASLLAQLERSAMQQAAPDDPAAVSDLLRLLREAPTPAAQQFRLRFQQVTSALMAKAMEDTLFYRYGRLLAVNEVGGEPQRFGMTAEAFWETLSRRAASHPHAINATATHDTKRGEDARQRIAAIADAPEAWQAAVAAWEARLQPGPLPEPETRWHFYQALLGAWAPANVRELAERLVAYMIKAAREAKLHTSWTRQDPAYEGQLAHFVRCALLETPAFPLDFARRAKPFIAAGERKSLVQLALKLTLPGVPDIYQGTEWADLSLVDPDNRRPVDFDARIAALDAAAEPTRGFNARKLKLMRALLALRQETPDLFAAGDWRPLQPLPGRAGRIFGCLRARERRALVLLCALSSPSDSDKRPLPAFALPPDWQKASFTGVLAEAGVCRRGAAVTPADGFADWPLAISLAERDGR